MRNRHPVNVAHIDRASFGERIADGAAAAIGSWRFLIVQTIAVACWVTLNVVGLVRHWDVFPFVLLNLLFSVQAAYTGPVLLLAGNRQAQKDRLTLEHAAVEGDKADEQNQAILAEIQRNTEETLRQTELLTAIHARVFPQQTTSGGAANVPPGLADM